MQIGRGNTRADYALLLEGAPVVFIEAKGCDTTLTDSDRSQLTSYMRQTGVDWGLLTNGATFEILKRRTESKRPDEVSLGELSLEELSDNWELLRLLSNELVESGEADRIAERMEATRKAVGKLRNEKERIAERVTQVITDEIGDIPTQEIQGASKEYIDNLVESLEANGEIHPTPSENPQNVRSISDQKYRYEDVSEPDHQSSKNRIAGVIRRADIEGNDDAQVAVFPTKKSGLPFLKENNAWGFVRVGRVFDHVAMYVTGDVREVRYFATVEEIISAEKAELARPLETYVDQARMAKGKMIIRFETDSLYELADPGPYNTKYPQSLQDTTLEDLRTAKTTDDML